MATQKNIIDQVFPETLKVLSELIKFQTVSGTSNLKLIEYCEKKLNKLGAESFKTYDNDSKQRVNLFSTITGKKKLNGGGIILSGHTNVVPASAKRMVFGSVCCYREKDDTNFMDEVHAI